MKQSVYVVGVLVKIGESGVLMVDVALLKFFPENPAILQAIVVGYPGTILGIVEESLIAHDHFDRIDYILKIGFLYFRLESGSRGINADRCL